MGGISIVSWLSKLPSYVILFFTYLSARLKCSSRLSLVFPTCLLLYPCAALPCLSPTVKLPLCASCRCPDPVGAGHSDKHLHTWSPRHTHAMEAALAKVKFSGLDGESDDASDEEMETTRALVTERKKKGKKSGGFQSMGELY